MFGGLAISSSSLKIIEKQIHDLGFMYQVFRENRSRTLIIGPAVTPNLMLLRTTQYVGS